MPAPRRAPLGGPQTLRAAAASAICAGLVLVLAGCEGGTMSGHSQSCSSEGGLFSGEAMTCSGTVESISGQVSIEFEDEDLTGERRLALAVSVEEGSADVYATDAEGERARMGRVTAGEPLEAQTVVDPSGEDTVFYVDAGEGEVRGVRYEGRIERT